jgi:hypothetical protein
MKLLKSFCLTLVAFFASLGLLVNPAWSSSLVTGNWVMAQTDNTSSEEVRSPSSTDTEPAEQPTTDTNPTTTQPIPPSAPTTKSGQDAAQPKGPYDMDAIQNFDDALYGS